MSYRLYLFPLLISLLLLSACEEYIPTARPRAYPRIDLPAQTDRSYSRLESSTCPISIELPDAGKITRNLVDSCWVDISFEAYALTWHLTVRDIAPGPEGVAPYLEDHRKLVYKHSKKASRIESEPFEGPNGNGFWFDIYGEVGTPTQIFMTDPQERYSLVLSFYYQTATARDSLAPITQYMKEEMQHAISTIEWKY